MTFLQPLINIKSILSFYDRDGHGLNLNEIATRMRSFRLHSNKQQVKSILRYGEAIGILIKTDCIDENNVTPYYTLAKNKREKKAKSIVDSLKLNKTRIIKRRLKKQKKATVKEIRDQETTTTDVPKESTSFQ
uniref:H15 domain-containing protein n=1 Tax=Rhodnius prolixus TaxID=13249 RepID=T1HLT3_RHOPR